MPQRAQLRLYVLTDKIRQNISNQQPPSLNQSRHLLEERLDLVIGKLAVKSSQDLGHVRRVLQRQGLPLGDRHQLADERHERGALGSIPPSNCKLTITKNIFGVLRPARIVIHCHFVYVV